MPICDLIYQLPMPPIITIQIYYVYRKFYETCLNYLFVHDMRSIFKHFSAFPTTPQSFQDGNVLSKMRSMKYMCMCFYQQHWLFGPQSVGLFNNQTGQSLIQEYIMCIPFKAINLFTVHY